MSRGGARREELLDAAVAVLLRDGARRASVDEMARTAGVSKGAVYLEFASKQALLAAAVRREYRRYLADTLARVEADPEGGRLSGIYRHSIAALLGHPFMRALYTDDGQVVAGVLRGPEAYRPRVLLGEEFLRRMAAAGLLRPDVDPAVASHLLSVLAVGPLLAEPVLRDRAAPALETTFDLLAHLVVTGLEPAALGDPRLGAAAFRDLVLGMERLLEDPPPTSGSVGAG